MASWWYLFLVATFGALAVLLLMGGFIVGMIYSIRGSPSKAYQIFAISFALGVPSAGFVAALGFRDWGALYCSIVLGAFAALVCWLMSRFTRL